MRHHLALLLVPVIGLGLVACNDDNGNGNGDSEEAFCDRARQLEDDDDRGYERAGDVGAFGLHAPLSRLRVDFEGDPEEFEARLSELIDLAPDDDLRDALQVWADKADELTELEDLGDDDPEAIGRAFELLFDPEFFAATDTIDTYLEDVCGIEADDDFGFEDDFELDDFDDDFGFDSDVDLGADDDELSTAAIRSALEEALPGVNFPSVGSFSIAGQTVISVGVDLDSADPMDVCEAAVDYADSVTGNDSTGVEVTGPTGGDRVVVREPGESCATV